MTQMWQADSVGPTVRRECPLCDWHMDEPPPEMQTEQHADGNITLRVRQQSAVPAGLFHILVNHPDSGQAAAIRAECGVSEGADIATVRGRVVAAVERELSDALSATCRRVWS